MIGIVKLTFCGLHILQCVGDTGTHEFLPHMILQIQLCPFYLDLPAPRSIIFNLHVTNCQKLC